MKKVFLTIFITVLLAAGCSQSTKQTGVSISNSNTPANVNRDIQRKQDIADVQAELVLFKNDNHTFPQALSELSKYLKLPTAPTPPDGSCTQQQNTYTYTFVSQDKYRLAFCLGPVGTRTVTQDFILNATGPDNQIPQ